MSSKWTRKVFVSIVVLIVTILLLVWKSCEQKAQLSAFKSQINKFALGEQVFIEKINVNGDKIIEQEQIILSQKDALAHNLLELEELKKVQSQVVIQTNTIIDSVFIPFDDSWQDENWFDTMVVHDTIEIRNFIYVPKTFSLSKEHYSLSGSILKTGVMIDSLRFPNQLTLSVGYKSQGLFKKALPVVIAKHSNPFVQTSSMQNIVIKNDLKWYDKKGTWFGVGIVGGFIGGILINNN